MIQYGKYGATHADLFTQLSINHVSRSQVFILRSQQRLEENNSTEQTVNDTKKCQQTTNHTDKYYRISCAMADHADRTDVLIHVVIVDFISTTLFTFVIIQFALGLVDLLLLLQ